MKKGHIYAERIKSFSDAVIAIVLTILVLELKVGDGEFSKTLSSEELVNHLIKISPAILTYILSFLIIAKYWQLYNMIFNTVKYINRHILWLNLFFLLFISFLPMPSGILGKHYNTASVILFNCSIVIPSIFLYFMAHYLIKNPAIEGEGKDQNSEVDFNHSFADSLVLIPIAAVLSIGLSFVNNSIALLAWGILLVRPLIPYFNKTWKK